MKLGNFCFTQPRDIHISFAFYFIEQCFSLQALVISRTELSAIESKLFDWNAPTTFTTTIRLEIEERASNYLQIAIETPGTIK